MATRRSRCPLEAKMHLVIITLINYIRKHLLPFYFGMVPQPLHFTKRLKNLTGYVELTVFVRELDFWCFLIDVNFVTCPLLCPIRYPLWVGSHKTSHFLVEERDRLWLLKKQSFVNSSFCWTEKSGNRLDWAQETLSKILWQELWWKGSNSKMCQVRVLRYW